MANNIGNKIDALDEKVTKLVSAFGKLKADVDELRSSTRPIPPSVLEPRAPNDWTRMTVQALQGADISTLAQRFETYKPTVIALRDAKGGLTADGVSEKTGRSRQVEATYLNRLEKAGIISRTRSKNKVVFKLENTSRLISLNL